ncbi:MAG TPA: sulfite dehydrogenase, partial [Usitatibacter sp.]|nr:sulfite dehydrogenase [Usitatibacter sp.]
MADTKQRAGVEELLAREEAFLAVERRNPASPYFAGGRAPRAGRRRFMLGSMAALGAATAIAATRSRGAEGASPPQHEAPPDASKVQGYPLEDASYGSRSQFEKEMRARFKTATPQSSWTMTPLESGMGIITPSGLHFERSHAGTAVIDPAKHSLYVHGMVKGAKKFSMRDVKRFPSVSRI